MKNDAVVAARASAVDHGEPAGLAVTGGGAIVAGEAVSDDASTRQRVIQSILEHGPSTASALAERLRLTPAAIRRHLGALTDRHQITSREQRVYGARGRGRPSKVFALTDEGRTGFYQAYDELAIRALQALAASVGPAAVAKLAETHFAEVESRYLELRAREPARSPIEVLAEALSADGYVASTKPSRLGEQLCQHHCPVAHVAAQFPQICEAETQLFSRLLGSHVQRLATIAHGDGVCTTHVPSPQLLPHPTTRTHQHPHARKEEV